MIRMTLALVLALIQTIYCLEIAQARSSPSLQATCNPPPPPVDDNPPERNPAPSR